MKSPKHDTISSTRMIYDCLIGGKESKFIIEKDYPTNVISKILFRKLRERKFSFYTSEMVATKIGNYEFIGYFTSKIDLNGKSFYINFSVRDDENIDFAIINKRMAEILHIPHE
jgi:hypothetical protein